MESKFKVFIIDTPQPSYIDLNDLGVTLDYGNGLENRNSNDIKNISYI